MQTDPGGRGQSCPSSEEGWLVWEEQGLGLEMSLNPVSSH